MKKKTIILVSVVLIVVAFICVYKYYHPTHFAYNDRFIVGNTQEKIVEKYDADGNPLKYHKWHIRLVRIVV